MKNGQDEHRRGRVFCWSVVWLLVERRSNGIEPFRSFAFPACVGGQITTSAPRHGSRDILAPVPNKEALQSDTAAARCLDRALSRSLGACSNRHRREDLLASSQLAGLAHQVCDSASIARVPRRQPRQIHRRGLEQLRQSDHAQETSLVPFRDDDPYRES
jgi:hypothetical protein